MALLDMDSEEYHHQVMDFNKKRRRSRKRVCRNPLTNQDISRRLSHMFIQAYLDEGASEMQIIPYNSEESGLNHPYNVFVLVKGKQKEFVPPPRHIVPSLFSHLQEYAEQDGSFQVKYRGTTHTLQTHLADNRFTLSRG